MIHWLEYIWIDHFGNYRSKTKIFTHDPQENGAFHLGLLPTWNFDGSSTAQAPGQDSEVYIKPVYMVRDPFRRHHDSWLVLCDTWLPDGSPHPDNTRVKALEVFDKPEVQEAKPWYGLEQEFFFRESETGHALGMDSRLAQKAIREDIQGQYYCGVGAGSCFGRHIMDEAMTHMIDVSLNMTGLNFEVAPGQCEFQILNEGIEAGDQMHLARYILIRTAEEHGVFIDFHPKPFPELNINGSGCHTNFSTKEMREDGGMEAINAALKKLENKHEEHIAVYGKDNHMRLTGKHETADIHTFSAAVADRGASIRIPRFTNRDGKGYLEDRRPSSNMDPYLVTAKIAETIILN